jgi:hypothetical protein
MRFFIQLFASALVALSVGAAPLFDRVVAKGKNIEIKLSQVEENYMSYKANKLASGERVPTAPEDVKAAEKDVLDHLIATKLIGSRAIESDKTNALAFAEKFITEKKARALSANAFNRQLRASGLSPE